MPILVTGGTGLVGSHLIEDLIASGRPPDSIRVLIRPDSDPSFLRSMGVRLCPGDVTDPASAASACEGVEILFHCAAAVDERKSDLYREVNFKGTAHILEGARSAGVHRLIHISTIGVYGLLQQIPATEDHPKNPLRPYAVAKLAAEERLWEVHRQHGLQTVVLRPSAIIGERDRTITCRLVQLARRKIIPLINGGETLVSFVHVKDLTRAMILAAENDSAVGKVYNVEGFASPIRDLLQLVIDLVGSRARMVNVSYQLAYPGALLVDAYYALFRPGHHPIRARMGLRQLTRDMVFDTTRIRTDLDFEPRYDMVGSIRQAVQWQLEHG